MLGKNAGSFDFYPKKTRGLSIVLGTFSIKILGFSIEIMSFFIEIMSFFIEILVFFIKILSFSIEIIGFLVCFVQVREQDPPFFSTIMGRIAV